MNTTKRLWLLCVQLLTLLSITVASKAQLHADFSASPTSGCPPMVVNFKDSSTGGANSWKWDLGNGTISLLQNPIATYFFPGTYNVKLVIKSATGADSIVKNQFITVNELPVVRFGSSDTTGCFPLPVTFRDSSLAGSGTIVSWQWDFGDGTLSSLQNPTHIYTGPGSYNVTLRVTNSKGCSKVLSKNSNIKISNGVKANFNFASASGCHTPTPVTFTSTSVGTGALTYLWNFGDGTTSTVVNPIHNYTIAGTYTVSLIVTNSTGCTDTLVKANSINIGFVQANFSMPNSVCSSTAFTFNNTSTPASVGSFWSFGDGTFSTERSPVKSYATPGTYQVKLVSDFGSCLDSVTKSITIIAGPTANFSAVNNVACKAPITVTFTNTSALGTSYQWNFGDGTTSTLQNPVHDYLQTGNYTVTLIVTNANGCRDTTIKSDFVSIVPPQISTINNLPVKGCLPYTITPTAVIQTNQTVTGYLWTFGDGSTSTAANPSHTYTTPGVFDVKLTITTASGCIDTLTIVQGVKVGNKPTAQFSGDPREICVYTPVTFTDLSTNGPITEWFWDFGDGGTSVSPKPIHQYLDTGYSNVTLIATSYGCSDTLKKDKYIHLKPPLANFDTLFKCSDPLVRNFVDKSTGAQTWLWDFGDGTFSTAQNPSHTFPTSGSYLVKLKVTNGECVHDRAKNILVVSEQGEMHVSDSLACRNVRLSYSVSGVTQAYVADYSWYLNGFSSAPFVLINNPVAINYSTPGNYDVGVVVRDLLNCTDTLRLTAPVKIYGPVAGFTTTVSGTCSGNSITFADGSITDGSHPVTSWTWNFGDGTTQTYTAPPFVHQYDSAGLFDVSVVVKDQFGCADSIKKVSLLTVSKPIARYLISDTTLCPNISVNFTNKSQGIDPVYNWNFGDGTTSSDVSPTHLFTTEGNYTVRMLMVDKYGCTDSLIKQVRVFKAYADFEMSDSFSTCPPLQVNFNNKSTNYVEHFWSFGDGGTSTLVNPSHLYTTPGTFYVKLWVRNNGDCIDTLVKKIVIRGPSGVITYNPLTACNPAQVDFQASTQNTLQYIWDYNDGTTIFSTTPFGSHVYTTPGVYLPKLILEDAYGCRVPITGLDTIKINGIETHILAQNTQICDSGIVVFKDSTVSNDIIASYLWNFGDGTTSTLQSPTHIYNTPGFYNVSLIGKTQTGCSDTAVFTDYIKVVNSPLIRILGDSAACEPAVLNFQGALRADTSAIKWNWNFGNGQTDTLQNPAPISYATAGTYNISLQATNSDGCISIKSRAIMIHPKPVVNAGIDTIVCRYQPYTLQATGADSYAWRANATLSCTNCANPIAMPDSMMTYFVTGRTIYGCTNRDSINVRVKQPFKMTVGGGDTLCVGETFTLKASNADFYQWSPALWLNNSTIAAPTAKPDSTVNYTVIGRDDRGCFSDTGVVRIKVYPIPKIDIKNGDNANVQVGSALKLETKNSADVTGWKWFPGQYLSCANCSEPITTPQQNITYSVQATNAGNCIARDQININVICNNANIYIPNTFSPNNDGSNDVFFARGTGLYTIKTFTVFNRWGQLIFQKNNIVANDPSMGWDGTFNGVKLQPDVYVYTMEVICSNNNIFPFKGNITLLH